eukprot:TRINITY_DN224_c0_g3_i2.p1 TRINITY_DN224_c0_g3~~TRINITY_DN224_c0_g3_i2.p1  ORF type:complete len:193 (-),score=34.75 TRINITY_DN224_c0_g3_i2:92-670(-)
MIRRPPRSTLSSSSAASDVYKRQDIETVSVIDILTRGGIEVTIASLTEAKLVKCANGCQIQCQYFFKEIEAKDFDIIICPGGMGNAEATSKHECLIKKLKQQKDNKKYYAAICATPALAFQPNGLLEGEAATCYPALNSKLADQSKIKERVVVSNQCITSQAPGTAADFAFAIVDALLGGEIAKNLKSAMYF